MDEQQDSAANATEEQTSTETETEAVERPYTKELNELGPGKKLLRVEYGPDKVRAALDKEFNDLRRNVQIKGFRRGKAPRRLLERRYGKDVREHVRRRMVVESMEEALTDADLELVARPEPENVKFDRETGLSYEVTLLLRPSFTLPDLDKLEVEVPPLRVSESDLESALKEIAENQGKLVEVDESATVEEGDEVTAEAEVWLTDELDAFLAEAEEGDSEGADEDADEDDEGGLKPLKEHESVVFRVTSDDTVLIADLVVQSLADDVLGLTRGESADVDVVLPTDYEVMEGRGEPGILRLKIKEIRRPEQTEVNDEFAKSHGFDSLDDFKSRIRNDLLDQRQAERDSKAGDEIVAELLRSIGEMELPRDIIDSEANKLRQRHAIMCLQKGMSQEQVEKEVVDKDDEFQADAIRDLKRFFLLDAVAAQESIEVRDEELHQMLALIARSQGRTLAEIQQEMQAHPGQLGDLRWSVLEGKVLENLRSRATIKDAS